MNDWLDICCDCEVRDILHFESHKKMALLLSIYIKAAQLFCLTIYVDSSVSFFCLYLALTLIKHMLMFKIKVDSNVHLSFFIPLSKNLRNEVTAYWMKCTLCWNFHPDFIFYMLIWMLLNFCRRCTQNIKIPCFFFGYFKDTHASCPILLLQLKEVQKKFHR